MSKEAPDFCYPSPAEKLQNFFGVFLQFQIGVDTAITQNFIYEASDNKVHPDQTRVLSIYEGMVIQTVSDYPYDFHLNGKRITNGMFAQILGESVPPKLIDLIVNKMLNIQLYIPKGE